MEELQLNEPIEGAEDAHPESENNPTVQIVQNDQNDQPIQDEAVEAVNENIEENPDSDGTQISLSNQSTANEVEETKDIALNHDDQVQQTVNEDQQVSPDPSSEIPQQHLENAPEGSPKNDEIDDEEEDDDDDYDPESTVSFDLQKHNSSDSSNPPLSADSLLQSVLAQVTAESSTVDAQSASVSSLPGNVDLAKILSNIKSTENLDHQSQPPSQPYQPSPDQDRVLSWEERTELELKRPFTAEEDAAYQQFLKDEEEYVASGEWDRFPYGSRLFIGMVTFEILQLF